MFLMNYFSKLSLQICIICFALPVTGKGQTIMIQGDQNGILEADTIMITGNVNVPAGETLIIQPGTTVISTGFYGINVGGTLRAEGNENNWITFTVADTAGFYNLNDSRGGWNGIHFISTDPAGDSSLFIHCTFEYGKAFGDSLVKMGGIFNIRNFSKIRISGCEFSHNKAVFWGGAVFAELSDLKIENSEFTDNFCGTPGPPYGYGGAVCLRYSGADMTGCRFYGNSSTGIGGAASFEYSDVLLSSGIFQDNYSGLGGALGYLRSNPDKPVSDNLFTGNSSLFFGGAISCNKANPSFINNTITGNYSISYGGGFYCNDSAAPVLINTILYGNFAPEGEQVYIWDVNSAPSFYYCNVQGDSAAFGGTGGIGFNSPYMNNTDTLPLFSGIYPFPYALSDNSPCINAGNPDTTGLMLPESDLAGNIRIVGNIIDQGCYENQSGLTATGKLNKDLRILCYPNPFHEKVTVIFPSGYYGNCSVSISDLSGRMVFSSSSLQGNSFIWTPDTDEISGLRPGMYCVTVTAGNRKGSATVLHIK